MKSRRSGTATVCEARPNTSGRLVICQSSLITLVREALPALEASSGQSRKPLDIITQFPFAGRLSGEGETRMLRAGKYPYLIYWVVEEDEVRVLHIRHAAREGERDEPGGPRH